MKPFKKPSHVANPKRELFSVEIRPPKKKKQVTSYALGWPSTHDVQTGRLRSSANGARFSECLDLDGSHRPVLGVDGLLAARSSSYLNLFDLYIYMWTVSLSPCFFWKREGLKEKRLRRVSCGFLNTIMGYPFLLRPDSMVATPAPSGLDALHS